MYAVCAWLQAALTPSLYMALLPRANWRLHLSHPCGWIDLGIKGLVSFLKRRHRCFLELGMCLFGGLHCWVPGNHDGVCSRMQEEALRKEILFEKGSASHSRLWKSLPCKTFKKPFKWYQQSGPCTFISIWDTF